MNNTTSLWFHIIYLFQLMIWFSFTISSSWIELLYVINSSPVAQSSRLTVPLDLWWLVWCLLVTIWLVMYILRHVSMSSVFRKHSLITWISPAEEPEYTVYQLHNSGLDFSFLFWSYYCSWILAINCILVDYVFISWDRVLGMSLAYMFRKHSWDHLNFFR